MKEDHAFCAQKKTSHAVERKRRNGKKLGQGSAGFNVSGVRGAKKSRQGENRKPGQ